MAVRPPTNAYRYQVIGKWKFATEIRNFGERQLKKITNFKGNFRANLAYIIIGTLRSNGVDYVLLLFIFLIFYSPFVLRNYSTDSRQIFRNCVFWCSLNNPVVLKFF